MINIADPSDRNLLLSQLKEAVSCQIEFWDSINRLEEEVVTPEELTMKDVDNFLPELKEMAKDYSRHLHPKPSDN